MKSNTKIALVTASLLSMGALTACQSTSAPKHEHDSRMMGHQHGHHMSPEQREQFKQMRAERKAMHQLMQQACEGKTAGQSVQIKSGEKAVEGTCNMVFKADRKTSHEMGRGFHHNQSHMTHETRAERYRGENHRGERHMQQMTEEQRAQRQQQREQKRTQRQAQWDAIQKSCAGQSNGQTIQVKLGDKTLEGKCVVKFQPQLKADHKTTVASPQA